MDVNLHDLFADVGRGVLDHLAQRHGESTPADGLAGRLVLVTSTGPGEGKSFVAQGLAHALAEQQGGDVVWVDAAFDTPPAGIDASWRCAR